MACDVSLKANGHLRRSAKAASDFLLQAHLEAVEVFAGVRDVTGVSVGLRVEDEVPDAVFPDEPLVGFHGVREVRNGRTAALSTKTDYLAADERAGESVSAVSGNKLTRHPFGERRAVAVADNDLAMQSHRQADARPVDALDAVGERRGAVGQHHVFRPRQALGIDVANGQRLPASFGLVAMMMSC